MKNREEKKKKVIENWVESVAGILAWIIAQKIPFAEITLTVKGGKVVFVDYRGPLKEEEK